MLADFNMDGALDLIVVNREAPTSLFRNRGGRTQWGSRPMGNWLQIELQQDGANRNAVGATILVKSGNNTRLRKGENVRVFPLSNWTELDVWLYVQREEIPIVPLYLAKERPIVWRNGTMIMVDDERMRLHEGEVPEMRKVRFRTLGCYPLSGAVDSNAEDVPGVIQEMLTTTFSERQGRLIDFDEDGSMERKKREGYF